MTVRVWPLGVIGGRWFEGARERIRAFYYWLSLRHPWAWRVRLDLVLALNLLLGLLWLVLGAVTTRMADPVAAGNLAFNIIVPPAVGAGLYWAYAVTKSVRVRSATRFGAAPGPVFAVAVGMSFGCWAIAAMVVPYVYLKRDAYVGVGLSDFERGVSSLYSAILEIPPDARAHQIVRQDFARSARPADLWSALTFDIRKPRWFTDTLEHPLSSALLEFAKSYEPWKSRLAALPRWRSPYPVLADLRLRREYARAAAFEAALVAPWIGRNIPEWAIPVGEAALDDPEALTTDSGEEIAGAARLRSLFAKFDQAVAAGSVNAPPSFPPGVWLKLREMQFEDFAATLSGVYSARALTATLKETMKPRFERLEHDDQARGEYLRSEAYKAWRYNLAVRLAHAGAFDREIKGTDSFRRDADAWQDALRERASAPEMLLQQNLAQQLGGTYAFGVLAVLSLGLFTSSINRVGMLQTLVSVGFFAALSAALGAAGLVHYYVVIQDSPVASDVPTEMYAIPSLLAVLGSLTPLAISLIRRKHARWSVGASLSAVWAVAALTPFVLLGENIARYEEFRYSRNYVDSRVPSFVRDLLPDFPNQTTYLLFAIALWLVIAIGFAALVHALLARLAALPRPS